MTRSNGRFQADLMEPPQKVRLWISPRPNLRYLHVLQNDLPFPPELFTVIAEFLAGQFKLGTLASLNVTCRLIREATNTVLWTTVTLDAGTPNWNIPSLKRRLPPVKALHTRRFKTPAPQESIRSARRNTAWEQDQPGALLTNRLRVR